MLADIFLWMIIIIMSGSTILSIFFCFVLKALEPILVIFVGIAICVLPGVLLAGSISSHAHDLGTVRKGYELIEVREQAIEDIDAQLNLLERQYTSTSLLNADTPARSLIETKASFVSEIAEARADIAKAKISIERRSIGLMNGIVHWYGKE